MGGGSPEIRLLTAVRLGRRGMAAEAWARGQCSRRVGLPGAFGGWSGADSARGGAARLGSGGRRAVKRWRELARWSRGRAGAAQQHRIAVVLVAEVGGGRALIRQDGVTDVGGAPLLPTGGDGRRAKLWQSWRYVSEQEQVVSVSLLIQRGEE
jgi:hypothetical protein